MYHTDNMKLCSIVRQKPTNVHLHVHLTTSTCTKKMCVSEPWPSKKPHDALAYHRMPTIPITHDLINHLKPQRL